MDLNEKHFAHSVAQGMQAKEEGKAPPTEAEYLRYQRDVMEKEVAWRSKQIEDERAEFWRVIGDMQERLRGLEAIRDAAFRIELERVTNAARPGNPANECQSNLRQRDCGAVPRGGY